MAELYLFNKEEVLINIIPEDDFNNDSHVRELNSKWSFEFTTTFQYLNDLSKSNKVGFYDRYREFRLFKIIKEPEVDYLSDEVVVNCLNDCYEMSDQIIEDKRLRDGTARQALDKVLEGSSYEVGEVAELGNRTINFYDISRMEGLNNIIKSYGGELDYRIEFDADFKRISHKYVDIKSRLGQDTGLRFTYDLNLESVVRTDVSESHCTILYGRGGAIESGDGYSRKIKFTDVEWKKPTNPIDKPIGQTYIEDLDAIAKYGRIEGIYENSDIEEPGELLQATYEALQECKNPKLSYEVNAKDLASQNSDYDHLTVVLGDSVILLDEDYDLNLESRIVGFEESIKEESAEMKWIIGNVQSSFSSDNASSGQIIKPSTGDVDIEIDDDKFPDALPDVPIIEAEGLFGSVIISWTYESKSYYEYELYASKLENFNPDASNLIFRGKASSYHHQVKPSETWYYRARAINTHGRTTDFSSQVQASTLKIEDGTEYFEKAAIADALIGELRLDRGWVGQLKGNRIDARQLSVTDGNGKRTLDIDSFGNVNLDVASLKIKSHSVATNNDVNDALSNYSTTTQMRSEIEQTANSIKNTVTESYYNKNEIDNKGYATSTELQQTATDFTYKFSQSGGYNFVRNGNAKNGQAYWQVYYLPEASWGIRNDVWTGYETAFQINAPNGTTTTNAIYQAVDGLIAGETYAFSALTATHRGVNQIVIANGEGTVQLGQSDLATNCEGGTNISGWKRISGTFIATSSTCQLRLCHYWGSTNSFAWFKQVQINRGSIALPPSPHPSEVYDGIITMDKDGFDVATSYGAHTQFHSGGMSSYNNNNQRTLGIENGGISFHAWNNYALSAYITQSSLWGGSQSANGLAISTTANGTYVAIGTSSLSDVNTTLNMDQALTISASDGFQPRGLNLWKDVHAHGYGIRQLSHLHLAGSGAIQFDYLNNSPSTIYEAVSSGHSLYVMGGYQMHLGVMEGSGTPHGVIWMKGKTDTHSYTHWDFHNYTMYNMKTASTYANTLTKTLAEVHGVTSNVDGVRYLYRDIELIDGKAVRNLPNGYKGCSYDIVSIVCKGKGQAWIESEEDNRFEINGDCKFVNVEIIIYPADDVMMLSTVNTTEAPVLELPEAMAPEIAPPLTNEVVNSCDFWNQYMYSKYLFNLKKVTQMSGL